MNDKVLARKKTGLTLADAKTKAILITNRRKKKTVKVKIRGYTDVSNAGSTYTSMQGKGSQGHRGNCTNVAEYLRPETLSEVASSRVVRCILLYSSTVWAEANCLQALRASEFGLPTDDFARVHCFWKHNR